ncbi:60Kd inner membrane protein-domain-containing protein [Hypoxylon crocopeplum]|nr:60Kd inner membrane protein-domain-containing protein [Hypoxylon crocopeplum]
MLPSRGLSRSGTVSSALRNGCSARSQPARPLQAPLRRFSQAWSSSMLQSRAGGLTSSRSAIPIAASGVFALRSGASRNLSLWPFSSKQQPTSPEPSTEPLTPVADTARPSEVSFANGSSASASAPADVSPPTPIERVDASSAQHTTDSFSDLDLESILDIPEQIGYLKSLGLDFGWGPTSCCEWVLEHVYIYSGMPWWATLATVAIVWRAALFIPTLNSSKHMALMQQLMKDPAYVKAKAEFDEAAWRTRDRTAQILARDKMLKLKKASGASTMRSLAAFWTIPFSYGMFRLFRAMAAIPVPSLETGGIGWFTDLTVHDPYFILPMASVGLAVAMFKQTRAANLSSTGMPEGAAMLMNYVLPPMMFLCTAWLPAGIQWFFLMLTAGSVLQTSATLHPAFRRWAGIPPLPSKTQGPVVVPTWQAPTTPGQDSAGAAGGIGGMAESIFGVGKQKEYWKKAQAYEERRALEEKEKAFRRMEDIRRKRAEKKRP